VEFKAQCGRVQIVEVTKPTSKSLQGAQAREPDALGPQSTTRTGVSGRITKGR